MRSVNCGCDMPFGVYCDWLEDEGWDASELREQDLDDVIVGQDHTMRTQGNGGGNGSGRGTGLGCDVGTSDAPVSVGYGDGYWVGSGYAYGHGYWMGIGIGEGYRNS